MQITLSSEELESIAAKLNMTYAEFLALLGDASKEGTSAQRTEHHPKLLSTLPVELLDRLKASRQD
jgi:outer membrane protein TolC